MTAELDALAGSIESVLRDHVDRGEPLGLSWLVALGDRARSGAHGHLDGARTEPVAPDTIFRISSMSKPISAVATLLLVDDGSLALEQPIDELLPELTDRPVLARPDAALADTVPARRPITVEDVLTFRLGWGTDFSDFSPKPIDDALGRLGLGLGPPAPAAAPAPDEWIRRLATLPLQYQPGARWLYHLGAQVLGVLVARAAGCSFPDFLAARLFEPLGMRDTAFFVPAASHDRFGACFGDVDDSGTRSVYDPRDGQWASPPAFPGGGDGLVSTVGDYHRFADMLRRGGTTAGGARILSEAMVAAMTTNHLDSDQLARGPDPDGAQGWGYGVGVQVRATDVSPAGSYGWAGGLGSTWATDPASGVIGILLTNQMWTAPIPPPVTTAFWSTIALSAK